MATEDLTTWTEVDGGADITVTAAKIDVVTQSSAVTNYVYDDRGAAYYSGDFDHDFTFEITATTGTYPSCYVLCISNAVADLSAANPRFLCYCEGTLPYLADANTAWDGWTAGSNISLNTVYYCSLARVGNTLTWDMYSNSARTTLVQSIALAIVNTAQTFRYCYGEGSNNWGDAATMTYYVQDIDYKEATASAVPPLRRRMMMRAS